MSTTHNNIVVDLIVLPSISFGKNTGELGIVVKKSVEVNTEISQGGASFHQFTLEHTTHRPSLPSPGSNYSIKRENHIVCACGHVCTKFVHV